MLCWMQEVRRIRSEHLDDPGCIVNGRVKGTLKVTRAFGAGYLKEVCLCLCKLYYQTSLTNFASD